MKVIDLIKNSPTTAFSFEVLPPLKGNSIEKVFNTIDTLREFDPKYINITTHRSEFLYKDMEGGLYKRVTVRTRPGTVAVAAAIQNKYQIPAVPPCRFDSFPPVVHKLSYGVSMKENDLAK